MHEFSIYTWIYVRRLLCDCHAATVWRTTAIAINLYFITFSLLYFYALMLQLSLPLSLPRSLLSAHAAHLSLARICCCCLYVNGTRLARNCLHLPSHNPPRVDCFTISYCCCYYDNTCCFCCYSISRITSLFVAMRVFRSFLVQSHCCAPQRHCIHALALARALTLIHALTGWRARSLRIVIGTWRIQFRSSAMRRF